MGQEPARHLDVGELAIQQDDPEFAAPMDEVVIEDDDAANRALYMLKLKQKEIERIRGLAQAEVERVNQWADANIAAIGKQMTYWANPLLSFMESVNRGNPKVKTLKYPHGKVFVRMGRDKIEVAEDFDPEKHIGEPFVKEHVRHSADREGMGKAIKENGGDLSILPPWATYISGEPKFGYECDGDPGPELPL